MKRTLCFVLFVLMLLLVGCGPSEKDVIEQLDEQARIGFNQSPTEPNQELLPFSIYLPEGYKVESDDETNVVFRQTDQLYLLFHNPFENQQSTTYFEALKDFEDTLFLQAYEGDDYFGYVYLRSLESDYELQVGMGGTRITTQTGLDQIEGEVTQLITILTSIVFEDSETTD